LIQLTGRVNYKAYGDAIGIDVVNDNVEGITRVICGGLNGLADRERQLKDEKRGMHGWRWFFTIAHIR
jgi:predicted chitinase